MHVLTFCDRQYPIKRQTRKIRPARGVRRTCISTLFVLDFSEVPYVLVFNLPPLFCIHPQILPLIWINRPVFLSLSMHYLWQCCPYTPAATEPAALEFSHAFCNLFLDIHCRELVEYPTFTAPRGCRISKFNWSTVMQALQK